MERFLNLPLGILLLIIASIIIAFAGARLARLADKLADITKIGEALFGAILVGSVTSLPGIVTSVTSAYKGLPQFAVSNAVGGIILQTSFLAIADIVYRKVNLEHAAASLSNIMQGGLLIVLLSVIIGAKFFPSVAFFNISIISLLIIIVYIFGIKMIAASEENPMWRPIKTKETVLDVPRHFAKSKTTIRKLWLEFFILALIVAAAGYALTQAGIAIVKYTHMSQSFVAGLFTAGSSSLPELIITVAAVRQGSLALAVGNIIGGNTFDTLFIAFADVAYRKGSIYHAMANTQVFMIAFSIILTAILVLGLLYRQKRGPVKIGWESLLILCLTFGNYVLIYFGII